MYRVKYHKQVVKFLQKHDKDVRAKVINFFDTIKMDLSSIEHYDVKPLKGFDDKFRLRIGKYKIIFTLKEEILMIEVIKTGGRGNVYK